MAFMKQIAFM